MIISSAPIPIIIHAIGIESSVFCIIWAITGSICPPIDGVRPPDRTICMAYPMVVAEYTS
ncbi:MAG: hypothetical protein BWY05_01371 [Euryarchaeota archaeon ADurb.Bin165]|nr:MAG: hypothetical protein BWY05_01371 [Euryarchaeota archaeon ADurb.Bin165]